MKVLNFTEEEQWNIWTIVALVMHLGNVVFGGEEKEGGRGREGERERGREEGEGEEGKRGGREGGREGNKRKREERGLDAALGTCNGLTIVL